jgi:hypothetical protein
MQFGQTETPMVSPIADRLILGLLAVDFVSACGGYPPAYWMRPQRRDVVSERRHPDRPVLWSVRFTALDVPGPVGLWE